MCSKGHIGSSYLGAKVSISEGIVLLRSGKDVNAKGILQDFSRLDKIESGYCCRLAVDEFLSIPHIIAINCNYGQSGRGD